MLLRDFLLIFLCVKIIESKEYFTGEMYFDVLESTNEYDYGFVNVKALDLENRHFSGFFNINNVKFLRVLCHHFGYDSFVAFAKIRRESQKISSFGEIELKEDNSCCN